MRTLFFTKCSLTLCCGLSNLFLFTSVAFLSLAPPPPPLCIDFWLVIAGPLVPPPPSMQITPQLPLMGFVARVQETSKWPLALRPLCMTSTQSGVGVCVCVFGFLLCVNIFSSKQPPTSAAALTFRLRSEQLSLNCVRRLEKYDCKLQKTKSAIIDSNHWDISGLNTPSIVWQYFAWQHYIDTGSRNTKVLVQEE